MPQQAQVGRCRVTAARRLRDSNRNASDQAPRLEGRAPPFENRCAGTPPACSPGAMSDNQFTYRHISARTCRCRPSTRFALGCSPYRYEAKRGAPCSAMTSSPSSCTPVGRHCCARRASWRATVTTAKICCSRAWSMPTRAFAGSGNRKRWKPTYARRWRAPRSLATQALASREVSRDEVPSASRRRPRPSRRPWRTLAAARQLSPHQRAVMVLRYYEGLSEAEIARQLGCSQGSVKSHASRALERLRTLMPHEPERPERRRP